MSTPQPPPQPPATLSKGNTTYTYQSSHSAVVHQYTDPTGTTVIIKYALQKEIDTHREINDPLCPSIIRLLDVIEVDSSSIAYTGRWLILEHANRYNLRDLLTHVRDPSTTGRQRQKIPAAFCFHVLASILEAVIKLQETHGVQHIDLHGGNIVFHMPESGYPPLVKVIDFGKVFQLAEEEGWDDEVAWDEAPTPSVCLLVRDLLTRQRDVLEAEFLEAIRPLRAQTTPLPTLKAVRTRALVRAADISDDVPGWLSSYFGQEDDAHVRMGDDGVVGGQNNPGHRDQDNNDDGNGDLIFRFNVRME